MQIQVLTLHPHEMTSKSRNLTIHNTSDILGIFELPVTVETDRIDRMVSAAKL